MSKQSETGRFCIYTPYTCGQTIEYAKVYWKAITGEYPTRQKAIDEMNRRFKHGDAKVRKLPDLGPLTELQESVMTYLKYVGYDSCYNTLINSKYSIPTNRDNFMGGTGPLQPLAKRGLLAFKVGVVNPHRGGKRTCTVVALIWVHKYHERFGDWPSPAMIEEMEKENGKNKQSSHQS